MRRVIVIGNSGSGKTTVARTLASRLDVDYLELDGVFHQPGWTALPDEQFRQRVREVVAREAWVVDGNYPAVRELVWARADTVIWLDLPRWLVTGQVVRRTLVRGLRRQELWNGNREQLRNLISRDRQVNIVLWSWTNHATYRSRYETAFADPANAHLEVVRLRSRAEVGMFLAEFG